VKTFFLALIKAWNSLSTVIRFFLPFRFHKRWFPDEAKLSKLFSFLDLSNLQHFTSPQLTSPPTARHSSAARPALLFNRHGPACKAADRD
jgi:hypothetical protein